jgi:hypothetical protein
VSEVAEIKSAIEQLPVDQVRKLEVWLEEYQTTINASAEVFSLLDTEESEADRIQLLLKRGSKST